jgi:acetate kinase
MSGPTDMPNDARDSILTINGGSSSIKFALYRVAPSLVRRLNGRIERIGLPDARFSVHDLVRDERTDRTIAAADHHAAADVLLEWLDDHMEAVRAVGHRVVQGMEHTEPEVVTRRLLDDLHRMVDYDPAHLPYEIDLMERLCARFPALPQIACFDTAFHRTLPRVARLLPIPRSYEARGIRRYGFHGLSCAYLMEELERVAGRQAARGRVVLAHLGNGASMTAVRGGESVDTSMGFTPAGGLVMGTRAGDLDPGVAWFLMRAGNLSPDAFNDLVNLQSGLVGISEGSSDMRDLLAREAADSRARDAVTLFCYQARKWLGAYAVVLGGLDTVVFAGGIGENAPPVRARICAALEFLGIELDTARNDSSAAVISSAGSRVAVRVMRTDEESMIAKTVCRELKLATRRDDDGETRSR